MRKRAWIAGGVAALFVASTAWAATLYTLKADARDTGVSGDKESYSPDKVADFGSYQAVYGIEMWEQDDNACKLKAYTRHVNTYATKTGQKDYSSSGVKCDNHQKTIKFTDTDTFVRGVSVCLSSSGRVKGVRLYGTKLNRSTGKLTNLSGSKSFERPNCKTPWKTAVYCPTGKIASSIQLHSAKARNITGIGLQCRSVIKK